MVIHINNNSHMPTPRPNLDNPFKPQEPSTISDADALSALLGPEDAADARRLLGDKKELPDPESDEFVMSAEEQAVADAAQVEAEKSLEQRRKEEYFVWAKEQLGKDEDWVEDTFTFHRDGTVTVEGGLDLGYLGIISFPEGLTEVRGNVALHGCTSLKSLEHIPQIIGGYLSLMDCKSLTSLEHISQTIGGYLSLTGCTSLTSLEYISQTIGGGLNLYGCTSLTSLEHLSGVHIKGDLSMTGITSNLPEGLTVDGEIFK